MVVMKIFNTDFNRFNSDIKTTNSTSFRGKNQLTKLITTPNYLNTLKGLTATSIIGIASITTNLTKKNKTNISNDEIISLINNCKEKDESYNLEKLETTFDVISKNNFTDKESEVIIPLLRTLGNPKDWVKKYPLFAKYLSNTIVENTYSDNFVYNEITEALKNKHIKPEGIEIYESYLKEGYVLDKNTFVELHDKTTYLTHLPYNTDNFNSFSLDVKNNLIKKIEELVKDSTPDEQLENIYHFIDICDEDIVVMALNDIDKVKNLDEDYIEKTSNKIAKFFHKLASENINEEQLSIITKHMFSLIFLSLFDKDNFDKIINCPLYQDIIKNKKYLPLLDKFDYKTPYNLIDFKQKVADFENYQRIKFSNCDLLNEFHSVLYSLSSLPFTDNEIDEIINYIVNAKDKDSMKKNIAPITLLNEQTKIEQSKKDIIRYIKYLSSNPEIINKIMEKTNNIFVINSALKCAEENNLDIVKKIIESKIPVEYFDVTFKNISQNNINYFINYLENLEKFDETEINKILVLKYFKNPNNKSLEEIFNEIDLICKDTKQELNARFTKNISSVLNLKEFAPDRYNKIIASGYFELINDLNLKDKLNENADLNKNIYDDLEKLKNEESIIKEFDKNTLISDAYRQSKCGDVVSIGEKLYINDGDNLIEWQMSKQNFSRLFPPVIRFSTKQGKLGNCYLVSSLSSIMQNPKGRAKLYQLFKEDGNDLYVTIKGYEDYKGCVKIPNGIRPWNISDSNKHLDGCLGLELLEWAYAKTVFRDRNTENNIFVTENISDNALMERIKGGKTYEAIGEILGLEYENVKDLKNINKKSIELDIKNNINKKDFEDIIEKYCNEKYILNFATKLEIAKNNYNIKESHGHTIIAYDKVNKIITIENPHDCSISTYIPLDELYNFVDVLYIANIE